MKQTRRPKSVEVVPPRGAPAADPSAATWSELGRQFLLAGEVPEALWYLRQAVESDSECSNAWQLLGRCFEAMGEELRARRCYTLAFRLSLKTSSQPMEGSESAPLPIVWPAREPRDS